MSRDPYAPKDPSDYTKKIGTVGEALDDLAANAGGGGGLTLSGWTGAGFMVQTFTTDGVIRQTSATVDSAGAITCTTIDTQNNDITVGTGLVDGVNLSNIPKGGTGIICQTAIASGGTFASREVAVEGGGLSVADGDGVSGDPTITLDLPSFHATKSGNLAISASATNISGFNSATVSDTGYSFNATTGIVTVSDAGKYLISCVVSAKSTSGTTRSNADAFIEVNGTEVAGTRNHLYLRQSAYGASVNPLIIRDLSASDTVNIAGNIVTGSAAGQQWRTGTTISIVRLD